MSNSRQVPPFDFYARDVETLDRKELRALQDRRVRALTVQIAGNEFYKQRARATGVDLEKIETLPDLGRLPYLTKSDLVREQNEHPRYGRLPTYPLDDYRYFHQTSGTTGEPLKWLDTAESWDWFTRCWCYVYRAAGVKATDIVFCAFSFGPYISHWVAMSGARCVGALAISGGGLGSDQRIQMILSSGCTAIVCTPTYALHLAEVATKSGIDLRGSKVRIVMCAGEPGGSLPNVKRAIETAWGAKCFDHVGATEVGAWAFGCEAESGAIHLNEAEFVFEIIDPVTLEPVEAGARGELVVTNLGRAAMPVLRYRTGDLVELATEPCGCGRTFLCVKGGVLGRSDDMIILRGANLYPAAIDDLIRSLGQVLEYEVEVERRHALDDMLIRIEALDGLEPEFVAQSVSDALRRKFNIRVEVEPVKSGSLPRYEFKARRVRRVER